MDTELIICGVVLAVALLFGAVCWWMELRDMDRYAERLATDPEFARQQHEVRKNDDWEDLGYFDGR